MIAGGISATRAAVLGHDVDRRRLLARARQRISSGAAPVLAGAFVLWGLHHLDYPLLRGFGAAVLYGVFADVLFLFAIGLGLLFVVLGDERDRLAARTAELEQLTGVMLRVQEDERRRIAQELHDEAGQVLTAVKIELELDGRAEAGAMVGRALAQVRDVSNLLRPSVLDDPRAGAGAAGARRRLRRAHAHRRRARPRRRPPAAQSPTSRWRLPRRAGSADQRGAPRRCRPGARAGRRASARRRWR